ncbi:MAG TPA: SCO family protein [Burkholderiales bacterium]|nr:SCO family protein [Burkholderiales bacterium]
MSRSKKIALLAAAVAAAGGILFGILSRSDEPPSIAGFVYPEPRAIAPFALVNQDGKAFDLGALKGKWSFVYFGYSYCPDACPTTLAELSRAQNLLQSAGLDSGTQYIFVSVDSKRDTPRRLAQYVAFFNPKFLAATGGDDALAGFARQVGVAYSFPEGKKGKTYAVDHTSIVALFDPDARLHAVFTPPQKGEEIAEGFRKILRSGSRRAG